MTKALPAQANLAWRIGMGAACAALFGYLLYRNLGLNPAIFADEWYYSKMSRLAPLGEAIVPSYIYLWIYKLSNSCGDGFLDCVRIGNALFHAGAAPFLYLAARRFTSRPWACAATALALLAPFNLFTTFFMPESAYYFCFAVLSWMVLTRDGWSGTRLALAAGAWLGVMSLVKVHALFLLPALCAFLLYRCWSRGGRWLPDGLLAAAIACVAAFALKFGIGYLLAGANALSLFGKFYSDTAAPRRALGALLAPAFINGRGHLMALAVLLALPMAALLHLLLRPPARADAGHGANPLAVYTLLMLGASVGMTVAYTASIAQVGPNEVLRLHLRYYAFVFPLLYILAASMPVPEARGPRWLRPLVALLLAAALVLALVKIPLYSLNAIDSPELAPLDLKTSFGALVVVLDLAVLALWAGGSRMARPLFLLAAVPLTLWAGTEGNIAYVRQLETSWPPEKAGRYAHAHVPKAEHKSITVAAANIHELMRTQFHIDDKDVALLELAPGAPVEPYQLPAYNKWLLVVGTHPLPQGVRPVAATADFALVRFDTATRRIASARLSEPLGAGLLGSAEGLSQIETWGRWSDRERVVLHFNQPLPRRLVVVLKARAFGDNAGLPFTLRVGAHSAQFKLGTVEQDVALRFDTDGTQRSMAIEVPHPVSPAELGQSADTRKLGIGLLAVDIGAANN